jgi:hypothetical protein
VNFPEKLSPVSLTVKFIEYHDLSICIPEKREMFFTLTKVTKRGLFQSYW